MNTIKTLERLQRIHFLIEKECTGSPYELACKMNVSERSIYNLIDYLRDFEAIIRYDRSRKTYYYQNKFSLSLQISLSIGTDDEVTEILGGTYLDH
ncbi:DNA-binding protein [Muriicola sp.]|uniref:DNA-binding protein n=1 Tax=Muriicola sp. TaxID=2020856 RepID=UPI003C74F644